MCLVCFVDKLSNLKCIPKYRRIFDNEQNSNHIDTRQKGNEQKSNMVDTKKMEMSKNGLKNGIYFWRNDFVICKMLPQNRN